MTNTNTKDNERSPAPDVAAEEMSHRDYERIYTLSTGVRVRLKTVASGLINRVILKIPDPEVPKQDLGKGRLEPNPFDPRYKAELVEVQLKRTMASGDAYVMFGVELVDGVPPDKEWIPQLKLLARLGDLDLDGYDLKKEIDKEYIYKRYIAIAAPDMLLVTNFSTIRAEDVDLMVKSFRSVEGETPDNGRPAEEPASAGDNLQS